MNQKPLNLISVIIPAFNAEKSIERAVFSVLQQTYAAVEIIIIDDCSTDCTFEILEDLKGKTSSLRLIRHRANSGVSASRNSGLEIATGDWITFLDADDYLQNNYIEMVSPYLNRHDFICTSYKQVEGKDSEKVKQHSIPKNIELTDKVLLAYMEDYFFKPYEFTALMHCWNKFYRRQLLTKHQPRIK